MLRMKVTQVCAFEDIVYYPKPLKGGWTNVTHWHCIIAIVTVLTSQMLYNLRFLKITLKNNY